MDLTSPEHDAVVALYRQSRLGRIFASTDEQVASLDGADKALTTALARIDRARFDIEPGLACTYVTDRWTGKVVDLHYEAAGAQLIANRRNAQNVRDGREHLTAVVDAVRDSLTAGAAS